MVADAVLPGTVSSDVTGSVTFVSGPVVLAVTLTLSVQELLASIEAPVKFMPEPSATAVMAPPPQDPVNPVGFETDKPAGKTSAKETPVKATLMFGFLIVNVSVALPLAGIATTENDFVMLGGCATITVAEPVFPAPPSLELTADVTLL